MQANKIISRLGSRFLTTVAVCPMLLLAAPSLAANVPGDYPTIQAALNSGASQIFVAEGTYHEVLSVDHSVELLPMPYGGYYSKLFAYPIVDGMIIAANSNLIRTYCRGFRFRQRVTTGLLGNGQQEFDFDACRFDAGLYVWGSNTGNSASVNVRGCQVFGDLFVVAYYQDISANTVVAGTITTLAHGSGY